MKLEVGKKYKTNYYRVAWVKITSQDDDPDQPFGGISDHGLEFYFTSKGECLDIADRTLFTLTEEYAE